MKSVTAAAMIAQSLFAKRSSMASRICAALSTRTTSIARGHVEGEFAFDGGDQGHGGAEAVRHLGQGVSLATGGAIGE